jgi:endonuclease G
MIASSFRLRVGLFIFAAVGAASLFCGGFAQVVDGQMTLPIPAPQVRKDKGDPTEHLVMGNPSGATIDVKNAQNYLVLRNQYDLSYNRDRGEPNWVSWHLDSSWIGTVDRQNDFRPDMSMPIDWYRVLESDYTRSGLDRGHMCPSGDRTDSATDNSETFLMTNMVPQAPANNRGPWEKLEAYCRVLASEGNDLYIIDGPSGTGGSGSNGDVTNTLGKGHVVVPAVVWKVIIVVPQATNSMFRITDTTRTIAVIMPNNQNIGQSTPWQNFRVSIKKVEELTGYNFFSTIPSCVQDVIEARVDTL